MHLRLLALTACFLFISGCASTPDNSSEEGEQAAAESEEGLSEEPMGDEASEGGEEVTSEEAAPAKTLYDRIGGKPALEKFADKFVDALAANAELNKNANIKTAMQADQTRHKQMLAEFFCAQSGGPCTYSGRDAKSVHAPLKVSKAEWNVLRKVFIRTLKDMKVKKQERMDLALIAARQKKNIVTQ